MTLRPTSEYTILVVDDEPAHRDSLGRIFERAGYTCFTAHSGAVAQDYLEQQKIDIILTDLVMPNVDGLQLVEFVKKNHDHISIVLMTAYGTIENAVEAIRKGASDFLVKPIQRREVLNVIERTLERHALLLENQELHALMEEILKKLETINSSDQSIGGEELSSSELQWRGTNPTELSRELMSLEKAISQFRLSEGKHENPRENQEHHQLKEDSAFSQTTTSNESVSAQTVHEIVFRVGMKLSEMEERAIQSTLKSVKGDKRAAAKKLGIGLRTLYRKLDTYQSIGVYE